MNDARSSPDAPGDPLDHGDALDHRIDAALRRRFDPPPSLETLATRSLPPRRAHLLPRLAISASVAATVAMLLWVSRPSTGRSADRSVELASAGAQQLPELSFCRLVGPLLEGQPQPGLVHSPDLERLYHDMDTCQRDTSQAVCGTSDFLAERMSATYGQPLELRPEAAGRLHGPFGSDEWPTATIVTGTSDERTAVLVADRDATLACCVRMQLPDDSGLHLFTWQVGAVVLTEITPFAEPRLLAYFQ
jgi:hypothetical protein